MLGPTFSPQEHFEEPATLFDDVSVAAILSDASRFTSEVVGTQPASQIPDIKTTILVSDIVQVAPFPV